MTAYQYTARDEAGHEFSSVYTNVDNAAALRRELAKLGYVLVRAERTRTAARSDGHIRQREVVSFALKFAGMYSAGLSITNCLETLEKQADTPAFRAVIADVRARVQAGSSLKAAFEGHRGVFSDFLVGMIEAGESSGRLAESLEASAEYLEKRLELRQKTRAAFIYPIVVGFVCAVVVAGLLIFVVPVFSQMYRKLHVELPGPTRVLLGLSVMLRSWWWLLFPLIAGLALGVRRLLKDPRARLCWDRLKIRVPLVGPLNRLILVSQFVRAFGMLVSVGVPIVDALEAAGRVAGHGEVGRIAADLQQAIRAGRPVAKSLGEHELFPLVVVQLVASGEEAGILHEMLRKAADLLDKDTDRLATSLLVKLEPALTLIMGMIIGLILVGMYLPMFDYMACLK